MDEVLVEWVEEDVVLTVSRIGLSLEGLLAAAKVKPGTIGAQLVERIWAALFAHRRDLRQEYRQFFSLDYPSFGAFLFWKLDFPDSVIREVVEADPDSTIVGLSAASLGGGRGMVEWMRSDEGWATLEKLLRARRAKVDESAN